MTSEQGWGRLRLRTRAVCRLTWARHTIGCALGACMHAWARCRHHVVHPAGAHSVTALQRCPPLVRCAHPACAASPLTPAGRLFTAANPPPKHEDTVNSSAEQGRGGIGGCSQAADADAAAATFPAAR